jgi:hypothetical protein
MMNLVFNELSLLDMPQNNFEATKIMNNFVTCYHETMRSNLGFDRSIKSNIDLSAININSALHVSKWRNNTDKDIKLAFLGMCQRQCIYSIDDDMLESEVICTNGRRGIGLLKAFIDSEATISLASDLLWESICINAEFHTLEDNEVKKIKIVNISNEIDVKSNLDRIQLLFRDKAYRCDTPESLLSEHDILFPSLIFHENVIKQLKTQVQLMHIPAIVKKLYELELYFSKWSTGSFNHKDLTYASPQSQETLKKYKTEHTFDFNNESVLVSYHLRYTGNIAGRIYFAPCHKTRKCRICSITNKLLTVSGG